MEAMSDKRWKQAETTFQFPMLLLQHFFSGKDATGYEQETSDSSWTNNVYLKLLTIFSS